MVVHASAHAHPGRTCDSASQETCYSSSRFARKNSRHKMRRTESPTPTKLTSTISSPKRCLFIASGPPLVSTFVDLPFVPHISRMQRCSAFAGRVSELRVVVPNINFAEKRNFLRRGRLASCELSDAHTVGLL